jgi:hypothetical protein
MRCPECRARDACSCGNPKQAKSATCATCRTNAGEANGNWKGGRARHKAGYVMLRAPVIHALDEVPTFSSTFSSQSAFLGATSWMASPCTTSMASETTTDRRTLSCGRGPQPAGIRVSDAINWARSMYDRYVASGTPPTMLTLAPEHPFVRSFVSWDDHERPWPRCPWVLTGWFHRLTSGGFTTSTRRVCPPLPGCPPFSAWQPPSTRTNGPS